MHNKLAPVLSSCNYTDKAGSVIWQEIDGNKIMFFSVKIAVLIKLGYNGSLGVNKTGIFGVFKA